MEEAVNWNPSVICHQIVRKIHIVHGELVCAMKAMNEMLRQMCKLKIMLNINQFHQNIIII